jgi:hypothetical protein
VALGPGSRVAVVDPKTYEVKQYILVDHRRCRELKAEKSVPVGRLPWGVAVIP